MIVKLLTEHHLQFLSLIGAAEACPNLHLSNCWKSHASAQILFQVVQLEHMVPIAEKHVIV